VVCALAGACGGESPASPPDDGIEFADDEIRVTLARVPELTRIEGSLVVAEAQTIVIHPSADEYRAFSNVCTHAGCGIWLYAERRFKCQCHGSEYDVDGSNVVGPATKPLTRRGVTVDSRAGVLRIARR
jgi:Rieske Fe-S protein